MVHEPLYQNYSSVLQSRFSPRFFAHGPRTAFYVTEWGSLRLALIIIFKARVTNPQNPIVKCLKSLPAYDKIFTCGV